MTSRLRIRWFGQSAFLISGGQAVFVDPFGVISKLTEQGLRFDYPPIDGVEADVLLVTHEHGDHNAVEVVGSSPLSCARPPAPSARRSAKWSPSRPSTTTQPAPCAVRTRSSASRSADAFLDALGACVERIPESEFEPEQLLGTADEPTVALLSAPIERSATR